MQFGNYKYRTIFGKRHAVYGIEFVFLFFCQDPPHLQTVFLQQTTYSYYIAHLGQNWNIARKTFIRNILLCKQM